MGELKLLEDMAGDVNMGDFVRVKLNLGLSEYRGYVWWTPKEHRKVPQIAASDILSSEKIPVDCMICPVKDPKWIEDNKERFFATHRHQILMYIDNDIFLAGLDPYGKTENDVLMKKVQVVGINIKKRTLGREVVEGYGVLERAKYQG